jgi:hypothetical protein
MPKMAMWVLGTPGMRSSNHKRSASYNQVLAIVLWCLLNMTSASHPCDVVVGIHDTGHRIDDENHHEYQPVRQVIQTISLHVGGDESAECDKRRGLFECQPGRAYV